MKAILFLSILALSLLTIQTKEQTQSHFQKNRLASKLAQLHSNLTQARPWPIHGGHGPVITNFTKNLTHHKMADDESNNGLWNWPNITKRGPAVVNFTRNLIPAPKPSSAIKADVKLYSKEMSGGRRPVVANSTRNLTHLKKADDESNDELWIWPKFHVPVVINHDYKKNADDEFWSWPKFGGHGPVVVNNSRVNGTKWPRFAGHGPVVTNFTKNLTHHKMADDESNDELWTWPKFGGHGPIVNFTKTLIANSKTDITIQTDDELWSSPQFGGAGAVVVKNNTQLPPVEASKSKNTEPAPKRRFGTSPRIMRVEESKRKFLSF